MKLTVEGKSHKVEIGTDTVVIDGTPLRYKRDGQSGIVTVQVEGRTYKVDLNSNQGTAIVDGLIYKASLEGAPGSPRTNAKPVIPGAAPAVTGSIRALMPGKISAVKVKEGDRVEPGTILLILEAMKMENEIRSPVAGIVRSLPAKPGDNVNKGDVLALVE